MERTLQPNGTAAQELLAAFCVIEKHTPHIKKQCHCLSHSVLHTPRCALPTGHSHYPGLYCNPVTPLLRIRLMWRA